MGKSNQPDPPSLQKYGVPFYAASWLPYRHVRSKLQPSQDSSSTESDADQYYAVLAGGGGEGRSGIPNAVVLSHYDLPSNSLSPQPVVKHGLGSDLPYRMTVHPRGDGLICALPNSCRLFEWEENKENESHKVGIKTSEKVLAKLENVGQQLALAFNSDGSVLAVGGEDGYLRIFKWPSMEIILEENQAHTDFKNLCFSSDGKFLISLGSRGPGRVWNVTSSASVATLAKQNDEIFTACRFSQVDENDQILYIAAKTDKGGSIVTWNTSSWERISSKHVFREPISAFDVSPDGKFLAVGTAQGDVLLIRSANMRIQTMIKKAHIGIVTALAFSHDSRALVSASMDSSARVTLVEDNKRSGGGGLNLWIIILIIFISIAVYFTRNKEKFPLFG